MFLLGIILLTVVISVVAFTQRSQFEHFVFSPARILGAGEYHRMVSSAFIHVDVMHLAFNMYSLYLFAELLEVEYGAAAFAAIYLLSILGGSALSLLIHRNEPDYTAAGASGGVCGVIFACLFLVPHMEISLLFIPIWIPDWAFAFIFVGVSVFGMSRRAGNIGHDAHLGGAVMGMLAALIFFPEMVWQRAWLFAGLLLAIIVLGTQYLGDQLDLWRLNVNLPTRRKRQPGKEQPARPRSAEPAPPLDSRARERRINELLDRVATDGVHTLNDEEREFLNQHANKLQTRRNP